MHILYFSWMRERVGAASETVALASVQANVSRTIQEGLNSNSSVTVGDLIAYLTAQSDAHASAFAQPALIRAAVNQEHVKLSHPLSDGDEVALFPPVTGG